MVDGGYGNDNVFSFHEMARSPEPLLSVHGVYGL